MKKIALILALLMVFAMSGCDVSNNDAEATTETQTEAKTDGTQETKTDAKNEDNTESQTQTQTETQAETETVTETETETEVVTENKSPIMAFIGGGLILGGLVIAFVFGVLKRNQQL